MDTHSDGAVLQVAIQLEELGRGFYESLASVSTDDNMTRICRGLALAESHHRDVFSHLRQVLAAQGRSILVAAADLAEASRGVKEVVPDLSQMLQSLLEGRPAACWTVPPRWKGTRSPNTAPGRAHERKGSGTDCIGGGAKPSAHLGAARLSTAR